MFDVNPSRRKKISKKLRRVIYERDKNQCRYCKQSFSAEHLSIDHIIPVSRGGTNAKTNLVTSCKDCNNRKASKMPEQVAGASKFNKDNWIGYFPQ